MPQPPPRNAASAKESGVAIILVIFVIALASVLVVNLAYSTQLGARLNAGVQQSLQAEYILKSAVNLARVLIKEDNTPEDSKKDPWGTFLPGLPVPPELLGLNNSNLQVSLEIRPEEGKIPLRAVVAATQGPASVSTAWRDALTRLFQLLGFDNDNETDQTGMYEGRHFSSQELVANLIDYMDTDKEPYTAPNFSGGIEGDGKLPDDYFPNERIQRLGELASIPGYTPARIRKLTPFVTAFGNNRINVNVAPTLVLRAVDENIGENEAAAITSFRESNDGPFDAVNLGPQLTNILGESVYSRVTTMIGAQSRWFQVIAKVDNDNALYFIRAYLVKGSTGELPQVRSVELF